MDKTNKDIEDACRGLRALKTQEGLFALARIEPYDNDDDPVIVQISDLPVVDCTQVTVPDMGMVKTVKYVPLFRAGMGYDLAIRDFVRAAYEC